jgi:hypothetical protein
MALDELIEKVAKVRAATAADAVLKARFIAQPMQLMAEMGASFPPGVVLEVDPGPEGGPAAAALRFPILADGELSDAMLETVAGGSCRGGWSSSGGWGFYNFVDGGS